MKAEPVSGVQQLVVSALPQPLTDSAFIADYGAKGTTGSILPSARRGCRKEHHRRLRAGRPDDNGRSDGKAAAAGADAGVWTDNTKEYAPCGMARLQGERLEIGIISLEHQGNIIPVELAVYDSDGQAGIFVPGSMETDAAKEIGANMGSSLGSSINISTDAGAQLASDLGKGVIQGVSQYISKKMRTVRVHLKSGYRVLLYQENRQQENEKEKTAKRRKEKKQVKF